MWLTSTTTPKSCWVTTVTKSFPSDSDLECSTLFLSLLDCSTSALRARRSALLTIPLLLCKACYTGIVGNFQSFSCPCGQQLSATQNWSAIICLLPFYYAGMRQVRLRLALWRNVCKSSSLVLVNPVKDDKSGGLGITFSKLIMVLCAFHIKYLF